MNLDSSCSLISRPPADASEFTKVVFECRLVIHTRLWEKLRAGARVNVSHREVLLCALLFVDKRCAELRGEIGVRRQMKKIKRVVEFLAHIIFKLKAGTDSNALNTMKMLFGHLIDVIFIQHSLLSDVELFHFLIQNVVM